MKNIELLWLKGKLEEKEKVEKVHVPFTGLKITMSSMEERAAWVRLPSAMHYQMLLAELAPYLPDHNALSKCTQLQFDLFFFILNSGLSLNKIKDFLFVDGIPLPYSTLHDCFDKILDGFARWGRSKVKFLSTEEWLHDLSPIYENEKYMAYRKHYFIFVDGTIIQTFDSSDCEGSRSLWNVKHKCPSFIFFVMVTPTGRIVYLSEQMCNGKMHDKTHFEREKVGEKLEERYKEEELEDGWTFAIGGDKGYPFISIPKGWKLYITKSGENSKDVNEEGVESGEPIKKAKAEHVVLDPGIARLRGVVERVIGRIKSWEIFASKYYCSNVKRVKKLVEIVCGIINWSFEMQIIEKL